MAEKVVKEKFVMNIFIAVWKRQIGWIEHLAENAPPYSKNLLVIQAYAAAMLVFGGYLLLSLMFSLYILAGNAIGVTESEVGFIGFKGILVLTCAWVVLSFLLWVGQSDGDMERNRKREKFRDICNDPSTIKEAFLADTVKGTTILVVIYRNGQEESFFEGESAIKSHEQLVERLNVLHGLSG